MRVFAAVAMIVLAALPAAAQKPTREEEQRQRQALDHYQKGQDHMVKEKVEEAAREFKAAIELDPLMALAYFRLGQAHMSLRDYPKAEKDFLGCKEAYEKIAALQFTNTEEMERRRAQEIEQLQNQLSLISTGQLKVSNPSLQQQMQQRIDDLRRNQRKGGNEAMNIPAGLFVSLGSAYFYQGKVAEAEKEWKTAASLDPKLGEAHNNLAVLYFKANELDAAEKELKLAEKAGFAVNPRFKDDLKKARKDAAPK
jgi:tetratricopeptide (TPR) repeat protein